MKRFFKISVNIDSETETHKFVRVVLEANYPQLYCVLAEEKKLEDRFVDSETSYDMNKHLAIELFVNALRDELEAAWPVLSEPEQKESNNG